jgi:hypothetical protein
VNRHALEPKFMREFQDRINEPAPKAGVSLFRHYVHALHVA